MNESDLTILLTTKGRDIYTLRWLYYANEINLPYNIYIADGQPNNTLVDILKDKNSFPNLNYQHVHYNDLSPLDYYKKLEDAVNNISTKYIMLSDNDDFLLISGVSNCINKLNNDENYVACCGKIGFFYLNSSYLKEDNLILGAPKFFVEKKGGYAPRSIYGNSIIDRITEACKSYNVTYYSVFRKEVLLRVVQMNKINNFNSFISVELFFHLYSISLGSIFFLNDQISYVRQLGTSMNSTSHENIFNQIVDGSLFADNQKLINEILKINEFTQFERNEIKTKIESLLALLLKNKIKNQLHEEKMETSALRSFIRSFLKKVFSNYQEVLWRYRNSKKVNQSMNARNQIDLQNIENIMNSQELKKLIIKFKINNDE